MTKNVKETQKKADAKRAGRTRNFATIVYPESAPENWKESLSEKCVPCFISPLHDKDVNADGEPKKAHYHVLIMFDSVKTLQQAKEFCESFGGVGCQTLSSLRGMARYLCHLDNADKYQYDVAEVTQFGGADYASIIGLASDKYKAVREIIQYCKENSVFCYSDLLEYSAIHREDWFRVLCDSGTLVVSQYLKSAQWRLDRSIKR